MGITVAVYQIHEIRRCRARSRSREPQIRKGPPQRSGPSLLLNRLEVPLRAKRLSRQQFRLELFRWLFPMQTRAAKAHFFDELKPPRHSISVDGPHGRRDKVPSEVATAIAGITVTVAKLPCCGTADASFALLAEKKGPPVSERPFLVPKPARSTTSRRGVYPSISCSSFLAISSIFSGGHPGMSMPSLRPMLASTSLISLRLLRPKLGVRSISASVFCTRSPM
jgi:hypothetical protein